MDKFITKSKEKFGTTFNYDNMNYISTKKSINLLCTKHNNTFTISTRSHLDSQFGGCVTCDKDYRFEQLLIQSNKKHGDRFKIIKNSFKNYLNNIQVECKMHGLFESKPQNYLSQNNGGCSKCINKYDFSYLRDESKNLFNDNYDFSNFNFIAIDDKSTIRCIKHNVNILTCGKTHLRSSFGGCLKCASENKKKRVKSINNEEEQIKIPKKLKQSKDIKKEKKIITLEKDEKFKLLNLDNYDNLYKVSNYGKIFSIKTNIYMKTTENKNGYPLVRLSDKNGKSSIFRVHRLVGLMFVVNPYNNPFVDHIDNIRNNNYYKNLRWVTHKENMLNRSTDNNYTKQNQKIINQINENKSITTNNYYKNIGIIEGYDLSNYKINEYGNIINCLTDKQRKYMICDGYITVRLTDKNKNIKNFIVHRLIGYLFVKKPQNYEKNFVINHIDNNRLNNYYKNLEWCSSKENTTKYFTKRLMQLDLKTGKVINEFKTFLEAYTYLGKTYGSDISKCCKGIYKNAIGFGWKIQNNILK
jgi:hypothetical protein